MECEEGCAVCEIRAILDRLRADLDVDQAIAMVLLCVSEAYEVPIEHAPIMGEEETVH